MPLSSQVRALLHQAASRGHALSFDDVTLQDLWSDVEPAQVDLTTQLTASITLKTPIISAAMDTVTEAPMALALAKVGGMGVIHRNMSTAEQVEQVDYVRKQVHHRGKIKDPITFLDTERVSDVQATVRQHGYTFTSFPIVNDAGMFKGLLTRDQMAFVKPGENPTLESIMKPAKDITGITRSLADNIERVEQTMRQFRVKKLPIVDVSDGRLCGMYVWKDMFNSDRSMYSLDDNGHFLVGAAVGPGDYERADALIWVGCKVLVIDCSHGACQKAADMCNYIKNCRESVQVIVGNVASAQAAVAVLEQCNPDALKVGIGPGSICTTRQVTGHGVPQVTAVFEVAKQSSVSVVADGGIRCSGDIVKALAAGASCVMLGKTLAAATESPGLLDGKYKKIRGMGCRSAILERQGSRLRYQHGTDSVTVEQAAKMTPEGVEGLVEHKGSVRDIVADLCGGIKAGLAHSGAATIAEFQNKAVMWTQTPSGGAEGRPHDILNAT